MPMRHLRKTFNISDRSAGIRHGFGVDCLRIITNRRFDGGQIVDVADEIAINAEFRQEISKRVDGRTIQIHWRAGRPQTTERQSRTIEGKIEKRLRKHTIAHP